MTIFNKVNDFAVQPYLEQHNLNIDQIVLRLSNVAPSVLHTTAANFTEIAAGNGYVAGGVDTLNTFSENPAGTGEMVASDVTFTASGGAIAQFQYVYAVNATNPTEMVLGWYDHGVPVDLADGESFLVDFGANWMTNN